MGAPIIPLPISEKQNLKPEWIRVPDAVHVSGISRSSLYELFADGEIKTACLRKRNALRGIRLINYDSLMAYIESQVAQ